MSSAPQLQTEGPEQSGTSMTYNECNAEAGVSGEVDRTSTDKLFARKNAMRSTSSSSHSSDYEAVEEGPWIHQKIARDYFTSLLTSLYGLFVVIFALVLEIFHKFNGNNWLAEVLFYVYMYGAGIVFLTYCYIFMLYPGWFNILQRFLQRTKLISSERHWYIEKTSHAGEGAGSLYLRLGALFFGTVGVVLDGLEVFLCITTYTCFYYESVKFIISATFKFIQMHFIFCNSKISINGSRNFAKIGTMHLVAVNLWVWFHYVLVKEAMNATNSTSGDDIGITLNSSSAFPLPDPASITTAAAKIPICSRLYSAHYFGYVATYLTTAVIEYSLIGAAVMFILWKSIDSNDTVDGSDRYTFRRVKRKHRMRIDCSSSSTGLFAGISFLIVTFISIGVHSVFTQLHKNRSAQLAFGLADLALFVVSLSACITGVFRMQTLQFLRRAHGSVEILNEILLIIGLIGELLFCSTGIVLSISKSDEYEDQCEAYTIIVYVIRMLQVLMQTLFTLSAGRLRAHSPDAVKRKPGKQIVTFLLVANVTLFFFHTFESVNVNHNHRNIFGTQYIIVHTVAPLIVLYRFHSSVCLAEIWKLCYPAKNVLDQTVQYN